MAKRRRSLLEGGPRWRIVLAAGLAVSAGVIALREMGVLEQLELGVYDRLVAWTRDAPPARSRVVLIDVRESDLRQYGFPLSDRVLAQALEAALRHEPRAVGVDIFRSRPVPPGEQELERLCLENDRLVMIEAVGESGRAIPPPACVEGSSQVGFADYVADGDGKLRRGLLMMQGEGTSLSLGLRLARKYLAQTKEPCEPRFRYVGEHFELCGREVVRFRGDDGAYVALDDRGYQVLLDFRGPFPRFERYGLSELIDGKVPASALRERVVLIGTTAESVKDHHITPAARAHGVEVHALVIDGLLRRALDGATGIRVLSRAEESAFVLGAGVLGACAVLTSESGLVLAAALLLPMLGMGLGAVTGIGRGWWLPSLPLALAWAASFAAAIATLSLRERRERRHLTDLFGLFTSPEVVEQIWKQRADFEGGRPKPLLVTITALFSDLEGFTTASERMSPEDLLDWANVYMGALGAVIGRSGGVVDDYAGDGIKADFGVLTRPELDPTQPQRDAQAAVDCALEMGREIERLNQGPRKHTARVRVGIFTGPAVAGFLGSADRLKFTTIGDTVNTAARLETYDKESFKEEKDEVIRILVGETTRALLGDRYELQDLGAAALKGKAESVRIYRVWGLAKGNGDHERSSA